MQFPIQVTYGEGSSLTRGYTLFLKARGLVEAQVPAGLPVAGSAAAPSPRAPAAQQAPVAALATPQKSSPQQKEASRSPGVPFQESAQRASPSRPAPTDPRQETWPDEALPPPMRTTSTTQPQQVGRSPRVVPPQPGSVAPEETEGTAVASRQQGKNLPDSDETAKAMPTTYGPVHSGETLFQVARTIQPHYEGASEARLAAALYRKNPTAFRSGHPGRLMKGRTLQVPTREEVAAMRPAQASRILRGHQVAAQRDMPAAHGSAEARAAAPVPAKAEKPATMAQDQSRGEPAPQPSEQRSPAQERATVEFATRGRSSLMEKSAPAASPLSHPAGTKQQLAEGAGGQEQATGDETEPSAASPPRVTDQANQPAVLPGEKRDTEEGSSKAAAEPSSALAPPPSVQGSREDADAQQPTVPPEEPAPPVAGSTGQAQQAPSPAMPPPAKHQEGLGGQRVSVPWYIKLAVGIVAVACVLVGLIVFLSRRQRPEGAPKGATTRQASREREKTAPDLGLGEARSGAAEEMHQASELMACGLYQDAYGILERALATDGGNHRLRLKLLEAAAALGRFDEVRTQARLMEGLDLGPDERATLQHLMQATPQPDLAGAGGLSEPSRATQASAPPAQPAQTAASPDPHLESPGFAGDAEGERHDMVRDHDTLPEDLPPYASPAQAGHESADPDFDRWLTGGSAEQTQQDKGRTSRAEALPWGDDKSTSLADPAPIAVDFSLEPSSRSSFPGPMQEVDSGQPAVSWSSPAESMSWHEDEPSLQGGAGSATPKDEEPVAPADRSASPERVPGYSAEAPRIMPHADGHPDMLQAPPPFQTGLQHRGDSVTDNQPTPQQGTGKSTADHASVLARPWEQQPAVAARGPAQQLSLQPAQRELPTNGAGAAGSADERAAKRGGEPGQGMPHGDLSLREGVGQPGLEPQPPEKTTPNSLWTEDLPLSGPAQRPTQGMPAHEWPDASSLSLSPADRRQEEAPDAPWGQQHETGHGMSRPAPAWPGQELELEAEGTQDPVLDISGMTAEGLPNPAAGSIQDYDFGQDVGEHEQERQVLETYAHWGQVPQSSREQAGDMASGMPATEWTISSSEEQPAQKGSSGNAGMRLDARSIADEGPAEQRLATAPSAAASGEKDSIPDLSDGSQTERHGVPQQSKAAHSSVSEPRGTSTGVPSWHDEEQETRDHALTEEWAMEPPAEAIAPDVLSIDAILEQSSPAPHAKTLQQPAAGTQPTDPAHDAGPGPSERSRLLDRLTQLSRQRVDS